MLSGVGVLKYFRETWSTFVYLNNKLIICRRRLERTGLRTFLIGFVLQQPNLNNLKTEIMCHEYNLQN